MSNESLSPKYVKKPVYHVEPVTVEDPASPRDFPTSVFDGIDPKQTIDAIAFSQASCLEETETVISAPLTPNYFTESEITDAEPASATVPPSLVEALEQSVGYDGANFFANRRDRRVEMTATAYVLFQALQAGGDAAFDLAVTRIPPGLRQRAPSRTKLELLAVELTVKPQTTEERKSSSRYASLLVVAQAQGITSEGYRAWANGVDLADAEVKAKKIRAALKATAPDEFQADQAPKLPVYELQVAVLVDGKPKENVRVVIDDHRAGEFRNTIAQSKATGDLTQLVNDIADTPRATHA